MEASVRAPVTLPELFAAPRGAHAGVVLDLAALLQPVPHRAGGAVPRHRAGLRRRAQPRRAQPRRCSAISPRGYLLLGVVFHGVLRDLRDRFELQLSLQAGLDIVAITLLMYASGGIRSGLGVMLLISLTGAAIVAPRRLTFLYAALATIALLLEQSYWVLEHDAPTASFLQPGLLAIGYFVTAGVTSWLAQRVAANERLARQRGRELAHADAGQPAGDRGHARRRAGARPRRPRGAAQPAGAASCSAPPRLLGASIAERWCPGFCAAAREFEVAGRDIRLRPLERRRRGGVLGAAGRGHDARARAGAAAQARRARPPDRQHRARDPQPARRHQPRRRAAARGEARRRPRAPDAHHPRQRRGGSSAWCRTCCSSTGATASRPRRCACSRGSAPSSRSSSPTRRCRPSASCSRRARESWIEFDHEHLHQVMWNLLRNAVRYARAEPGSVRIAARRLRRPRRADR